MHAAVEDKSARAKATALIQRLAPAARSALWYAGFVLLLWAAQILLLRASAPDLFPI